MLLQVRMLFAVKNIEANVIIGGDLLGKQKK